MFTRFSLHLVALLALVSTAAAAAADASTARGRYIVQTAGCNDCHTDGYMPSEGKVPESQWLMGSATGFQGPWGTSYPANLRLKADGYDEQQWLARARSPMLPPMPWFNLAAMNDDDLLAVYRYLRSLGPAGEPAPTAAAPGIAVNTPYFEFVPKNLPQRQASAVR